MLQRKQTVFLLAAMGLAIAAFFTSVVTYDIGDGREVILRLNGLLHGNGEPIDEAAPRVPFFALYGLLALGFGVTIFLYGNRPRQVRVLRSVLLVALGVLTFLVITDRSIQVYLGQFHQVDVRYGPAFYFLIAMLPLGFIAERFIRADEELVRSTERLR